MMPAIIDIRIYAYAKAYLLFRTSEYVSIPRRILQYSHYENIMMLAFLFSCVVEKWLAL